MLRSEFACAALSESRSHINNATSRRLAISAKELASRIGDKALVKPVPNGVIV